MSNGVISALKVRFSADNSQFKRGMKENQRATADFKSAASGDFSKLASLIGVDVSRITESFKSAQTGLALMSTGFKGAAVGSGVLSAALKILKIALVSTGVGAIVVALGSLIAYLSKTKEGTQLMKQAWEGVKAVFDVFIDRLAGFGKGLWELLKGIATFDWQQVKSGATSMSESFKGIGAEIKNEAKAAWELQGVLNKLDDRETELMRTISERRKVISQLVLDSRDQSKSAEERLKAVEKANALEKSIIRDQINLQRDRVKVYEQQHAMSNDLVEDEQALAAEQAKLNDLEREGNNRVRELVNRHNELMNTINRETEAYKKAANEKNQYITGPLQQAGSGFDASKASRQLAPMKVQMQKTADEIKTIFIDLNSVVNQSMVSMVDGFAGGMAAMITGAGGAEQFKNVILSGFAGMAVQAGSIIAKAGIAFFAIGEAFRKALTTPGAAIAAIAAGTALMAVGRAAQASLNNVSMSAGGAGYSSSPSRTINTRSGSNYSSNNGLEISGQLTIAGRDLALVLNKENVRRSNAT